MSEEKKCCCQNHACCPEENCKGDDCQEKHGNDSHTCQCQCEENKEACCCDSQCDCDCCHGDHEKRVCSGCRMKTEIVNLAKKVGETAILSAAATIASMIAVSLVRRIIH